MSGPAKPGRGLRERAEELARAKAALSAPAGDSAGLPDDDRESLSPEDTQRTLHELRVHQIELELQNEELRRAQAELDAERSHYFDLYDLAPVGYLTVGEQGLIREANFTAAALLGVVRGALVNLPISRFILKEDQDIYYRHRKQLFETGAHVCELRMLRRDGPHFLARMISTAARDAEGLPVGRIVLSDITAHNLIVEAFRRKTETFLENDGDLSRFLGVAADDPQIPSAAGRREPIDVLLLEDEPPHAESVKRAFLEADQKTAIRWARTLREYHALVTAHPPDIAIVDIELPDGNAANVLTAPAVAGSFPILILSGHGDERIAVEAMKAGAFDYIEKSAGAFAAIPRTVERSLREWRLLQARRRAEETLVRMEENYRRSLDDSPLGVRIVSASGRTLYANREILDYFDFEGVADFDKRPLKERYTPKTYAEFQIRKQAREQGEFGPREYEIAIVRKDGEIRHLQVFRKEVFWDGEKQFQALYRDITEEKKRANAIRRFEAKIHGQKMLLAQQSSSVEELIGRLTHSREELASSYEALKANKDDLVRSEKLAFTGRMAAGIAHEIRNPLTNIVLSLRQLKNGDGLKSEGHPFAEIIERNSKRIEYLVTELLNCARSIKLDLQPWDIHEIIEGALSLVRVRQQMQKIKMTKNLAARPAILPADKEYLGRVFLNILSNAIEAMPHGGALSIETKIEAGRFLVKIQDDGVGISEKNLLKIFDPFFSTKKGGTGLGLSTCQNIVTSHGGLIEVESAWRKGSVFVVSLPLESKPSDHAEGA